MLPVISDNSQAKSKSFWSRPEGTTGMITVAALAVGGIFLAQAVLPILLSVFTMGVALVGKAIVLTILCTVLAGILYVLTNKKFQTLVKYMFKSVMRKVTSAFVEIDPIGIMKGYIETLQEKKAAFDERKTKLRGQVEVFEQQMNANQREADKAGDFMAAAKKQNDAREMTFHARERQRLIETNEILNGTLVKMKGLYTVLTKYGEAAEFVIRDLKSDVKLKEQQRKMMLTSHGAIAGAMAILKGSGDEKELFDQALDFVVEDYAQKMGEIDDFMSSTESIMNGINLQNGMWEEKALRELESWEKKGDSLVLGGEKRLAIQDMSTGVPMDFGNRARETVPANTNGDFNKFFKQ